MNFVRVLLGCLLVCGCLAAPAEAATLYLNPAVTDMHPGDSIRVAVRLDADEGECINVVSGVIAYDPGLQPVDISRGQSILPIWVEAPTIDRANSRITFAGGIPNGYCGRIEGDPSLTNVLFEIILQAPSLRIGFGDASPTSTLRFTDETIALRNDGRGTPAPLETFGADVFVHSQPGGQIVNEWSPLVAADTRLPQEFSISLNRDDAIFNGRYFIAFNTTDKETGIDHYELIEEPIAAFDLFKWGAANAPWQEVRSPYVLEDQSLNSTIRVKAIDKAGNEYIATLVPEEALRGLSREHLATIGLFVAIGSIGLVAALAAALAWRRRRATKQAERTLENV